MRRCRKDAYATRTTEIVARVLCFFAYHVERRARGCKIGGGQHHGRSVAAVPRNQCEAPNQTRVVDGAWCFDAKHGC
eukprot:1655407-Lingulodinium_polyedra.AAC.1